MNTSLLLERFDSDKLMRGEIPFDLVSQASTGRMPTGCQASPDLPSEKDSAALPSGEAPEDPDPAAKAIDLVTDVFAKAAADLPAARARTASDMADTIASALGAVLPSLVEEEFRHEIAAATLKIILATEAGEIRLSLHPEDHDSVIDALELLTLPNPVTIVADTAQPPGAARLMWAHGGAEIDRTALLEKAQELFNGRIQELKTQRIEHE